MFSGSRRRSAFKDCRFGAPVPIGGVWPRVRTRPSVRMIRGTRASSSRTGRSRGCAGTWRRSTATGIAGSATVNGSSNNSIPRAARASGKRLPLPRTDRRGAAASRTAGRCTLWPAGVPPASGPGGRDACGAGPGGVSGLWRRDRSDPRGIAVSGRNPRGAPGRAPLRHRGRSLLAVSAARAGPARAADLGCAGRGRCATGPRRRGAGRRVAHRDGRTAGKGRPRAADHVRPAGDAGRPRSPAAPHGPRRRADLHGAVRAGPQLAGGHAG